MKTKSSILLFASCFIFGLNGLAQLSNQKTIHCGSSPTKKEMVKYREQVKAEKGFSQTRDGSSFNLPIVFHILRRSDGSGGVPAEQVTQEMKWANEKYVGAGIEFFECSPAEFINDDDYFNTQFDHDWTDFCGQITPEYEIAGDHNVANVINIYYVNTLDGWNWGAFPSSLDDCHDWIIMDIADTGTTWLLAHELGHYFNLLHTFQGYGGEQTEWENITRNTGNNCYNCGTTGDLLCDTKADPNHWSGCIWSGIGVDYCGETNFDPDEKNIMSYANGCQEYFTAGQIDRIVYAATFLRAYLDCPFLSTCQSSWDLSSTQSTMFAYQASDKITSTATINSGVVAAYDAANSITLKDAFFAPSGSDFHALNEGCWGPEVFKDNEVDVHQTSIVSTEKENNFSLYPNPASSSSTINFFLTADAIVSLSLSDLAGRTLINLEEGNLAAGNHGQQLNLNHLSSGAYIIWLVVNGKPEVKKLVVQH